MRRLGVADKFIWRRQLMPISELRYTFFAAPKKTSAIRRLVRVLAVVALTGPLKSLAAKAQLGPACGLLPSSCELQGELFDGGRCRCVKPGNSVLPPPCGLVPSFCELRGETFNAKKCKCVPPRGSSRRDTCGTAPFLCESR
jgi:hypothetical protein